MQETPSVQARLRDASALPETLAVSFDAFEAIRLAARSYVDRIPELFAAFMTAADAAVEGREDTTTAPSLPVGPATAVPGLLVPGNSVDAALDILAALGALLESHLTQAAAAATIPADRLACDEAARAARRIHQLMARGDDGPGLR